MIRKITLLFLACLASVFSAQAQRCGTDDLHKEMMANDPVYAAMYNAGKVWWANYAAGTSAPGLIGLKQTLSGTDSVYEIPVVVHIIDTASTTAGSRYNPTNTQIANTIDYVNQCFAGTWPAYPAGTSARIPLKFVLAKRDPNCNTTTGIVRINGATALSATLAATYLTSGVRSSSSNPGIDHADLKALSYWPNTEYYNIWVVNRINGANGTSGSFTAGFATYPGGNPLLDGTLMLATQFVPNAITLVHEIGHGFNLPHTFDGENTSLPAPASCPPVSSPIPSIACVNDNDGVCDTEPNTTVGAGPGTCPTGVNPCTGFAYAGVQYNFMNYTNCQNRFTAGQRKKMFTAFLYQRGSLISSLGATEPNTMTASVCAPSVTNPNVSNVGPGRIIVTQGPTPSSPNFTPQDTIMNVYSEGYSGEGNVAYIDNSCKHRVMLKSGTPYVIRVVRASTFTERVKIYIDYNNDGDFADPGEEIFNNTPTSVTLNYILASFTPPVTGVVNCIPLRMRIISERASAPITFTSCSNLQYGQAEDYSVIIKGAGNTSNIPGAVTLVKPPVGGNPSCTGTTLKFQMNTSAAITPVYYRWFRKNGTTTTPKSAGGVSDTIWQSNIFNNLDTVWVRVAYAGACGIDTTVSDSIVVNRATSIPPAVSIAITKGTNPGCPDDTVRFTVVSNVNPGGNPGYIWHYGSFVRDTVFGSPDFDTFSIGNNVSVFVEMVTSASFPCAPFPVATSNIITYTHQTQTPVASIALTQGTNPGCANQALMFSAAVTYGGLAPTYQWLLNGIDIPGATGSTYSSSVFANGDMISCRITSNSTCVLTANRTQTSNAITITHIQLIADVQIAIVAGTNTACQGHQVIFSANTSNSGANPDYEWMVNNVPVANTNSPIFAISTLANGDKVACILKPTDPCVQNARDTSAEITMIIKPSAVPSVTFSLTGGKNPWCFDSLVTFTAIAANAGVNPNYEWLVNGFPTYNGPVFANDAYLNGDVVICRVNQTDGACYLPDTVFSAPVTMIRSSVPDAPIIHLVNNMLITNKAGTYRWYGPAGLYTTGINGTFHPTELGLYMAVTDNNGCWSNPSNFLYITLLDVNTVDMAQVNIYPNPTQGRLVFDWGTLKVNMNISVYNVVGQEMLNTTVANQSYKELDLSGLTSGVYQIVMKDDQGHSGTAKITVTK